MLATVQVPEQNDPIIAAASQFRAIWTAPQRLHRSLMCFADPQALSAVYYPPAQRTVTAPTDQHISTLPVHNPDHRIDYPGMPRNGMHTFPVLCIPDKQLSALSAAASRDQPRPAASHRDSRRHDGSESDIQDSAR